jgi:hypothetical protein
VKRLTAIVFLLFSLVWAQNDSTGGVWSQKTLTSPLLSLSGTASRVINLNDSQAALPLGFSFVYYDSAYDSVTVTDNGFFAFGNKTNDIDPADSLFKYNRQMADTGLAIVAVMWQDWHLDFIDFDEGVFFDVQGTAPYRVAIIYFVDMVLQGDTPEVPVSAQVRLYETLNTIEVIYEDAIPLHDTGGGNGITIGSANEVAGDRYHTFFSGDVSGHFLGTSSPNVIHFHNRGIGAASGSISPLTIAANTFNEMTLAITDIAPVTGDDSTFGKADRVAVFNPFIDQQLIVAKIKVDGRSLDIQNNTGIPTSNDLAFWNYNAGSDSLIIQTYPFLIKDNLEVTFFLPVFGEAPGSYAFTSSIDGFFDASPPKIFAPGDVTLSPGTDIAYYDFSFATNDSLAAGLSQNVTVTAKNVYGETINDNSTVVSLTAGGRQNFTFDTIADTASQTLSGGAATFAVRGDSTGVFRLEALDGSVATFSDPYVIVPAAIDRLFFENVSGNYVAGFNRTFKVFAYDGFDNLVTNSGKTILLTEHTAFGLEITGGSISDNIDAIGTGGYAEFTMRSTVAASGYRLKAEVVGEAIAIVYNSFNVVADTLADFAFTLPAGNSADAGISRTISILAVDRFGNQVSNETSEVTLVPSGGDFSIDNPQTLSGGQADFAVQGTSAGVFTFTVDGFPGAVSPSYSIFPAPLDSIVFPAITNLSVGDKRLLTLTALDAFGNTITDSSGLQLTLSDISGNGLVISDGSVEDSIDALNSIGEWQFGIYSTNNTDNFRLRAYTQAPVVSDTSVAFNFKAESASYFDFTFVDGNPLIVDNPIFSLYTLEIYARDRFGNTDSTYAETVRVKAAGMVFQSGPFEQDSIDLSFSNGSASVSFNTTVAGQYQFTAEQGDIFTTSGVLTMLPGPVVALNLPFVGPLTAGVPKSFTITAIDNFSNPVTNSTHLVVEMTDDVGGAFTITGGNLTPSSGALSADGTVDFIITGTVAQTYGQMPRFRIQGIPPTEGMLDTPVDVVANTLAELELEITDDPGTAGSENTFTIRARDFYANIVDTSMNVQLEFLAPILVDGSPFVKTKPLINGEASFAVESNSAGDFNYAYREIPFMGLEYSGVYTIDPGAIHDFEWENISEMNAGDLQQITVQAVDIYDNPLTNSAGLVVEFSPDGPTPFSISGGDVRADEDALDANGKASVFISGTRAGNNLRVRARKQGGGLSVSSNAFNMLSTGSIDHYIFTLNSNNTLDAGIGGSISVQAMDIYENLVESSNFISLEPSGGSFVVTPSSGQAMENGAADFNFVGTETGTFTFSVDGLQSTGVSEILTIKAGRVDSLAITGITDEDSLVAGIDRLITVTAIDEFGNVVNDSTGYPINVSQRGGPPIGLTIRGGDIDSNTDGINSIGEAQFIINGTLQDTFYIVAQNENDAIESEIIGFKIKSSGTISDYALNFTGGAQIIADGNVTLDVTALDFYGNPIDTASNMITFRSAGLDFDGTADSLEKALVDGTVSVIIHGDSAAIYTIEIDDGSIARTIDLTIEPTDLDRLAMELSTPSLAGTNVRVTLFAYDEFNNLITNGAGSVQLRLSGNSSDLSITGGSVDDSTDVLAGTGTSVFYVRSTVAANYRLIGSVAAGAPPATVDSLFVVNARPDILNLDYSTDRGAQMDAGQVDSIRVVARDIYGNQIDNSVTEIIVLPSEGHFTALGRNSGGAGEILQGGEAVFWVQTDSVGVYELEFEETDEGSTFNYFYTVNPAVIDTLISLNPGDIPVYTGSPIQLVWEARDAHNNVITDSSGLAFELVPVSGPDLEVDPQSVTLKSSGRLTFYAYPKTAGTDAKFTLKTLDAPVFSQIDSIDVTNVAATQLLFSRANGFAVDAGLTRVLTIIAADQWGNRDLDYNDGVDVDIINGSIGTDVIVSSPADFTDGELVISITGNKAGVYNIEIDAGTLIDTLRNYTILPGRVDSLAIDLPAYLTAGEDSLLLITAYDAFDNVIDDSLGMPVLVEAIRGTGLTVTGSPAALNSSGVAQVLLNSAIAGNDYQVRALTGSGDVIDTSAVFIVQARASAGFTFDLPPGYVVEAGKTQPIVVTAVDINGNRDSLYTAKVALTASGGDFEITPDSVAFVKGQGTFSVRARATGTYNLTTADAGVLSTDLTNYTVNAAPVDRLSFAGLADTPAGAGRFFFVRAYDSLSNLVNDSAGLVIELQQISGPTLTFDNFGQLSSSGEVELFYQGDIAGTNVRFRAFTPMLDVIDTSMAFNIIAESADHFTFSISNGYEIDAGGTKNVVVTARDVLGNRDSSFTSDVALTTNPTGTFAINSPQTFVKGQATYSVRGTEIGIYNLVADGGGLRDSVVNYTILPAPLDSIDIQLPGSITAGILNAISITVYDAFDNPVEDSTNLPFLVEELGGSDLQFTDVPFTLDGAGESSFTIYSEKARDDYRIRVYTADGSVSDTTAVFSVDPNVFTDIAFNLPDGYSVDAGLERTIIAYTVDDYGNVTSEIDGAEYEIRPDGGNYIFPDGQTKIIAGGQASWKIIGLAAGERDIDFESSTTLNGQFNDYTITPAPIDTIIVQLADGNLDVGSVLNFDVLAEDAFGNAIKDSIGLPIEFEQISGPDIDPSPTSDGLDALGTASFTINPLTPGAADVQFRTAPQPGPVTNYTFNVQTGAAVALAFSPATPFTIDAGQTYTLTVSAVNGFGQTVTSHPDSIFLADVVGLEITPRDTTKNGQRTFDIYSETPGAYLLFAQSGALDNDLDPNIVLPAPIDSFAIPVVADQMVSTGVDVTATALDRFGNAITDSAGMLVYFESLGAAPDWIAQNPVPLDGAGQARFQFDYLQVQENLRFRLRTPNLSVIDTSNAFNLTPQNADHLTFSVNDPVFTNAGDTTLITVFARDMNENIDVNYPGIITLSLDSGPGVIAFTPTGPTANGQRTYKVYSDDASKTLAYTLQAQGDTYGLFETLTPFWVYPLELYDFQYTVVPDFQAGSEELFTVTAVDRFGNSIDSTGMIVTLEDLTGGNLVFKYGGNPQTTGPLDANAEVEFTVGSAVIGSGYQFRAKAPNGLGITRSNLFNVTTSPLSFSQFLFSFSAGDPASADAGLTRTVTLTAADPFLNPVDITGAKVLLEANIGDHIFFDGQADSLTKTITGSQLTYTVRGDSVGVFQFTASAGAVNTLSANYTILPAPVDTLIFTNLSDLTANVSQSLTLLAQDAFGNAITDSSGMVVTLEKVSGSSLIINSSPGVLDGSGRVSFNLTSTIAGTDYRVRALTGSGDVTDTSAVFSVVAQPATQYEFSVPDGFTARAGDTTRIVLTARDDFGNRDSTFAFPITLNASDGVFDIRADGLQEAGRLAFKVVAERTGTFDLIAPNGSFTDTLYSFTVTPAALDSFAIENIADFAIGFPTTPQTITIEALDRFGNTVTDNSNLIVFFEKMPANSNSFSITPANEALGSDGEVTQTVISGTDVGDNLRIRVFSSVPAVSDTSNPFSAIAGNALSYAFSISNNHRIDAGKSQEIVVTAVDFYGNRDSSYTEFVEMTISEDTEGYFSIAPAPIVEFTKGQGIYSVTGTKADTFAINLTDYGSLSTDLTGYTVLPARVDSLGFENLSFLTAGVDSIVTVRAYDAYANVLTDSVGMNILLTEASGNGLTITGSPAALDAEGKVQFTLNSAVAATDYQVAAQTGGGDVRDSSAVFEVRSAGASRLVANIADNFTIDAGKFKEIVVRAVDVNGNQDSTFTDQIDLVMQGGVFIVTPQGPTTKGQRSFTVFSQTAGTANVELSSPNPAIGSNLVVSNYTVEPAFIDHFVFLGLISFTSGNGIGIQVEAQDVFNNPLTDSLGMVVTLQEVDGNNLVISGTPDVLDANGRAQFNISGTIARDGYRLRALSGGLNVIDTSGTFAVVAANADRFTFNLNDGHSIDAGQTETIVVTARDQYTNRDSSYNASVDLTITPAVGFSSNAPVAFSNGQGIFTVQGDSAGIYKLKFSDTFADSLRNYTIAPAPIDTLIITGIDPQVESGALVKVVVTAYDALGNVITDSSGAVPIKLRDTSPVTGLLNIFGGDLSDSVAYLNQNGSARFTVVGNAAGNYQLTAFDVNNNAIASQVNFSIVANQQIAGFALSFDRGTKMDAGQTDTLRIQAQDAFNQDILTATGTIKIGAVGITFNDSETDTIETITLQNGQAAVGISSTTAADYIFRVYFEDVISAKLYTIEPAPVDSFDFSIPVSFREQAGNDFIMGVRAYDSFGNRITDSTGVLEVNVEDISASNDLFISVNRSTKDTTNVVNDTGRATFWITGFTAGEHQLRAFTSTRTFFDSSVVFTIDPAAISRLEHSTNLSGLTGTAGVAFADTVRAYDLYDNIVYNRVGEDVSLTASSPSVVVAVNPVELDAEGKAVFSISDTVAESFALTARFRSITGVLPGVVIAPDAENYLLVRSEEDGAGFELGDSTVSTDDNIRLYAAVYDQYNNFIDNTDSVDWVGLDDWSDQSFSNDYVYEFNPNKTGSGRIYAEWNGGGIVTSDTTGTITFNTSGSLIASIRLQTNFGPGEVLSDSIVVSGNSMALFANAYDARGNHIPTADLSSTKWSVAPTGIALVPSFIGSNFNFIGNTSGSGQIIARYNNLTSQSGLITVVPDSQNIDFVLIRDDSNNRGSDVSGNVYAIDTDTSLTFYAAAYDQNSNYITDIAVNWLLQNGLDTLISSPPDSQSFFTLAPIKPSVFDGYFSIATDSSYTYPDSVTVGVNPGGLRFAQIRDAAGNAGNTITTDNLVAGDTLYAFLAGYDRFGNYIADFNANWEVSPDSLGSFAGAGSDSTGVSAIAYRATKSGRFILYADELSESLSDFTGNIVVAPAAAEDLVLVSGNNQTGVAGSVLGLPLVVVIEDFLGNGVPGEEIVFKALHGGNFSGSDSISLTSSANGFASAFYKLRSSSGPDSVLVYANGIDSLIFNFNAIPSGSVDSLFALSAQVIADTVGRSVTGLTIQAWDANDNAVPDVPVSWAITNRPAGDVTGALSENSGITNAFGRDSVNLTIGSVPGLYRVSASAGGLSVFYDITASRDTLAGIIAIAPVQTISDTVGMFAADTLVVRLTDSFWQCPDGRNGCLCDPSRETAVLCLSIRCRMPMDFSGRCGNWEKWQEVRILHWHICPA